ncbi:MAG: hypothetical protein NC420_12905 [Eubacterium sp.]|nr:hypothetical protein [Eubacterium sp.]MCM1305260.1 hypothetical protein [Butyrivibrio sp.]MCM1343655.1 hypothetical protein [Muribaculaceae bacterium]MCM1410292.1 hypothetical protein [Lachnospiraceae bacterium]
MAGSILEKGKIIYSAGQPVTALHIITKGKVQATYPGGAYTLGEGDVIGICEICSEIHFVDYVTLENITIMTYPLNSIDALEKVLRSHAAMAKLVLLSMFRQLNNVMGQIIPAEAVCDNLHQELLSDYGQYTTLCNRYRVPPQALDLSDVSAYLNAETPDTWLGDYYLGLQRVCAGEASRYLCQDIGLAMGILRRGSQDFQQVYASLEEQFQYRKQIASFYFNESGDDLFEMLTSLYFRLGRNCEDTGALYDAILQIIEKFEKDPAVDQKTAVPRIRSFRESVSASASESVLQTDGQNDSSSADPAIMAELSGSLTTILGFAGLELEIGPSFRKHVLAYRALEDKNSTEEEASRLRRQLTTEFNSLYATIFERSLQTDSIPVPVRMFLYFGYVDEELAGESNCAALYDLANHMEDHSELGAYTFYDWLRAIYDGRKNPSRNEFDEDFFDNINKQKATGKLTEAQATAMKNDALLKVRFELENLFTSANKITSGRITTFCPLFAADNVMKDLRESYVTISGISKTLEMIKSVDYSAFYRESLDLENSAVMGKEAIHLEFLPDVILMPNVGVRGVMWQEIEGKKRNSPARMLFSIFHMEDLNTTMVRLTGEFRWEMCKRVQGSRWNDLSERSLTSEYFDYVQFYRKNHELTNEAKEKIKTSLQRAKNSFKEMFVRDYIVWVFFEGTGSPRLNKVVRKILLTYCPFPAALSKKLEQNPMFTEMIAHRNVVMNQRLHHIDMFMQKLRSCNTAIPRTLEAERAFTKGEI